MDTNNNPWFMLCVLFIMCFSMKFRVSSGADTISANQTLSGHLTIISEGEIFELGFFKPGNSSNYYIGMWYKNIADQPIVWVANREQPVSDTFSSVLNISNGNLVLFNESNTPIWSTNLTSTTSNSVVAVLGDDGNLVLVDASNPSTKLWQSFDHPAHTWLPGSKLGLNKKTNKSTLLTSWKNEQDPAPGLFSLELDPSGTTQYLVLWNLSILYWTSGPWDEQTQIFRLVPEMTLNHNYNFTFVSNENESYFYYNTYLNSPHSRLIMDYSGQFKQLNWLSTQRQWLLFWSQPRTQCEVYAFCGPFGRCNEKSQLFCDCLTGFEPKSQKDWDLEDFSGGCKRSTNLQCGNSSLANATSDGFLACHNMALPENPQTVSVGSAAECESTCFNNCSCTSYAYDSGGCSIWSGGNLLNLQLLADGDTSGKTIYIKLAASELIDSDYSNSKPLSLVLAVTVTSVFVLSCTIVIIYVWRRKVTKGREKRGNIQRNAALHLHDTERRIKDFIDSGQFKEEDKKGIDVPFFDLESILAATDNFSDAKKLGKGGFGPVYKGNFPGGQEIAVKRLSSVSGQGLEEFKNEVVLIAKLQHRNLVRLLGYCIQGDEKILIYEYMPNKSLDSFIFDEKLRVLLDWEMRFNIILGIARGLLYLHQDSRLRIIHRDLKTSNILLNGEMNPKISDFGLARIFEGKQTEGATNRVVGTYGYMSPEYALDGFFSVKSDVFSFGVVVLEIIGGRRNTGFYNSEQALSLLGYAWRLCREDKALDLMDQTLHESCNVNEFLKCINVGLLCVQEDPNDRPTMSNAIIMLGGETATVPTPKRPAFVVRRALSSTASPSIRPVTNTELTDSLEEGR